MLRRKILKYLCAAPVGSLLSTTRLDLLGPEPLSQVEEVLQSLFAESAEARQLGALYREGPGGVSFDKTLFLRSLLPAYSSGPERLLEELLKRINNDFERDEVTLIGGWMLSQTEAKLCAVL